MTRVALYLKRLGAVSKDELDALYSIMSNFGYDEKKGFGFLEVDRVSEQVIKSEVVLRRLTFRTIFRPETQAFEEIQSQYFESISFAIDSKFNTLEIFSKAQNVKKLVSILAQLSSYSFEIGSVNLQPAVVLEKIRPYVTSLRILKINVARFKPSPGLVGRLTAKVLKTGAADEIVKEQGKNLKTLQIAGVLDNVLHFELEISESGRLLIKCDEEQYEDVFSRIKLLIFGDVDNA